MTPPKLANQSGVADLFFATCKRLRELGATRVSGFGLSADFGPMPQPSSHKQADTREDPLPVLSEDGQELQARATRLAAGGA